MLGRSDRENFKAKAIGAASAWLHHRADLGWRRCRDVWSYDSIEAQTHDDRRIRLMALIVARECLAIRIALEAASRSAESEIVRLCAHGKAATLPKRTYRPSSS